MGETVKHLRLTWRNALSALEARGGTVQVAAALLLLRGGEQRQDRAIKLLVSRQTAT